MKPDGIPLHFLSVTFDYFTISGFNPTDRPEPGIRCKTRTLEVNGHGWFCLCWFSLS